MKSILGVATKVLGFKNVPIVKLGGAAAFASWVLGTPVVTSPPVE
jgi:hypothetical protein